LKGFKLSRKEAWLAGGAVVVLISALYAAVAGSAGGGPAIPTVRAGLSDFAVAVDSVGELDSEKAVTISSELKEESKIVFLTEDGIRVEEGDILIRLDPAIFEQAAAEMRARVEEMNAMVAVQQQTLEWEKIQAVREIRSAEFDLQVALLELEKQEKGDGPLEKSRLEGEMLDARKKYEELEGYISDLEALAERGYSNPLEIAQARAKVEQLREGYEVAKRQFESYTNYILPTQINTAKAKVQKNRMLIEQTKRGEGFKIGKAIAELDKSKKEYLSFKAALEEAEKQLERTVIRAPQAGLAVLKETYREGELRKPRIGDTVLRNQPLLFLPDITEMMVKVLVREVDLHKIAVGKPAEIRVDAYPDLMMTGEVSFIGVLAERRQEVRGGEKYFRVHVEISGEDSRLRPGMTARVRIIAQARTENVLTLPIQAVFLEEERPFCFVVRGDGFEKREVRLGAQNESLVQITSGLRRGERICLSRPPAERVRRVRLLPPGKKETASGPGSH
jgi:HlyD family secretion protein